VKLSCPSCGAKYSIADEKVHDRLAKIRCRKCSATIIIDGKVSPPNVYTSDVSGSHASEDEGGGAPAAGQYSVDFGDNDQRSMSADDIVQAYRRGELTRETYAWADGMGDWTAIGDIPELSGMLDSTGGRASAPQPAAPRAAARSGSGRGSAHDLFGGIEAAGSEADVTTSAPQPAAPAIATGARNESSVLFSLSALTASAGSTPSSPTKPSASMTDNKVDDSGLIDLKALTSSVSSQGPVGPLGMGNAPLGMAAPLGGITAPAIVTDDHMPRPQGGKTGLYIAGALVVVGALIAGAIVFTQSKEPPAAAANAVTTPAVTAAPAPTPEKKEELAAPPATGTAESAPSASALAKVSAPRSKSGGGSKSKPPSGGAATEKAAPSPPPASEPAAEKPKPKPKSNACNCAPGDLMCAMKCAAGH
jgi:predicted Zn finger-like uncharacterized protein